MRRNAGELLAKIKSRVPKNVGDNGNLEPRVSPVLCQQLVSGRNSGMMAFHEYSLNFLIGCLQNNQPKNSKNIQRNSKSPRVSPGD